MRIITGTDLSYIPFGLAHKILGGNEIIYEEIQDIFERRTHPLSYYSPLLFVDI